MGSRSRKMGIAIGNIVASRREFLAAASAVCTAATFAMHGDVVAEEGSKLIDTHHFYPPAYQKAWADWEHQRKIPHLGVQLARSRDQDIEAMDKDGPQAYCH